LFLFKNWRGKIFASAYPQEVKVRGADPSRPLSRHRRWCRGGRYLSQNYFLHLLLRRLQS